LSRHLGPNKATEKEMLQTLGLSSLEELVQATLPKGLASAHPPRLPPARSETRALADLEKIVAANPPWRSLIGLGYHGTITPPVLRRAILEDPGWYTSYTPYQPEISQGRLEALLNYQTMVLELTGMEIANASLLDEGTAAAEAASLAYAAMADKNRKTLWLTPGLHPSSTSVISTRAAALGWRVVVSDSFPEKETSNLFAGILAYPESDGRVADPRPSIEQLKKSGALSIMIPVSPDPSWRTGRRCRRWEHPTVWRPHRFWWSACRLLCHPPRLPTIASRSADRCLERHCRSYRLSAFPPNPRAAYPSRPRHQQHLHRPGPPRCSRLDVRHSPRPKRPLSNRPPHSPTHPTACGRSQGHRLDDRPPHFLRHAPYPRPTRGAQNRTSQGSASSNKLSRFPEW
ncbi:MAG: hypothetical protein EBS97_10155, partial [Verrucomicrobia bacterium]|nr:hypothetical protein [Verrucomicrobiota bacterium]